MTKNNQRIMLVGPRSTSNVVSGMRIGFDLLIAGFEERHLPYVIVDRSLGMSNKTVGTLTLRSVWATVYLFILYWYKLFTVHSVYITIGISRFGFFRDAFMIWAARILGKRIVLHLKGGGFLSFYESSSPRIQKYIRNCFAQVDIIIVLGYLLVDQFSFVPRISEKLRIVPNGLPRELQRNTHEPKSLTDTSCIQLLYLSNMIPTKGYVDVLEACRILKERQIPVSCNFCGAFVQTVNDEKGLYSEEQFYKLIHTYQLDDMVAYHGTVRGKIKQQFLQNTHLFLLPTYYPWEGQPISIIEALAFGTPVISTRYRGIPEQVIDGYNGFLVSPQSPEEIANAVETLWRDSDRYQKFSENALTYFQENFTQISHLDRLIPILIGEENNQ